MSGLEIDPVLLAILICMLVGGVLFILVMMFGDHLPFVGDLFNNGSLRSGRAVREEVLKELGATEPQTTAKQKYLHQEGVAQTYLRPAGKVRLASGELLDVITRGDLIAEKTRVRVVDTSMNRIVVEAVGD